MFAAAKVKAQPLFQNNIQDLGGKAGIQAGSSHRGPHYVSSVRGEREGWSGINGIVHILLS